MYLSIYLSICLASHLYDPIVIYAYVILRPPVANVFVSLSESIRFLLPFRHSPFDVGLEPSREEKDSRCERKLVYRDLINIV